MGRDIAGRLRFGVLGPLEAARADEQVRLGGERQRALLALLLIHANELVTVDQLAEQLFGEERRDTAGNAVHVGVSRLRRALEAGGDDDGVLHTHPGGYVLEIAPEQLDAAMFEQLLREGTGLLGAGDAELSCKRLRAGLALWRGPPLADLAHLDCFQAEIRRLEELRLVASMERTDADLALGRGTELVAELESLLDDNPLLERLTAQLMLALYRAGRQADALSVYRRTSDRLRDELGLDPSPGLQELERSILVHDPSLDASDDVSASLREVRDGEVCPFKGLASFGRSDADYFSGREAAVSDLVARAAEGSLVGIVGPSGIGKSSLLCAGALAALSGGGLPGSDSWRQVLMRPGDHPCAELTRSLGGEEIDATLAGLAPGERLVVAVDQLEEAFTVCRDGEEREAFLECLARAADDPHRRALVFVSLRADFYGGLASHARFARCFSDNHALIGPMNHDEIERAIEQPAARAGLGIEPRLVQALADDVEGEPGGLPLLSTALLQLWRVRDGGVLRVASYRSTGGVQGAVARLAEDAYGRLPDGDQAIAKRILLRLAGGESESPTRRRLPLADVAPTAEAGAVVSALTDDRLLTVSEGSVEVCHESLFREWPRYRAWLEEDREGRRLHAHLTAGAREWESGGRDSSDLYRGARLTGALEWAAAHAEEMASGERRFLDAGRRHAGRQARRLRALLVAMALLAVASLVAGLVAVSQRRHASTAARIALARQLGAEAVNEPQIDVAMLLAHEAVNLDPSPQTESSLLNTILRSPAVTGTLSVPGDAALDPAVSPDGRMLAVSTVAGLRLYDTRTHALLGGPLRDLSSLGGGAAAFSADGSLIAYPAVDGSSDYIAVRDAHTLAPTARLEYPPSFEAQQTGNVVSSGIQIAADRRTVYFPYWRLDNAGEPEAAYIDRWSLPSGRALATMRAGSGPLLAARVIDGGTELLVVSTHAVSRFEARSMRLLRSTRMDPAPPSPSAASVSPDGASVIIGSADGAVSFADVSTGRLRRAVVEHRGPVRGAIYTDDRRRAVTFGDDGSVIVWNTPVAAPAGVLPGPAGNVAAGALSPDGRRLYTTSRASGAVLTWDLVGSRRFGRTLPLPTAVRCCGPVSSPGPPLAVSPDGSSFATRIAPSRVGLFSAGSLRQLTSFEVSQGAQVTALAWSPTGTRLAVAGRDGLLQLWDVSASPRLERTLAGLGSIAGLPDVIPAVAFSSDGRLVAATDYNETRSSPGIPAVPLGRLGVWRVATGAPVRPPRDLGLGPAGVVDVLAFAHDTHLLAVSHADNPILLLDASTGRVRRSLDSRSAASSLAFAPNGTLAVGTDVGSVQLWNGGTGKPLGAPVFVSTAPVTDVAFDTTGQHLATSGDQDGAVKLWFASTLQQEGSPLTTDPDSSASVAFAAGTGDLLAVDDHGHGFTWPMTLAAWEQHACAVAGRNFTRAEWTRLGTGRPYTAVCR
jgi:DNA-binding SARP family transcriptional activator/WD40 repeat protein/energy-coupling factor transporter ATP-binding protein EcfA2